MEGFQFLQFLRSREVDVDSVDCYHIFCRGDGLYTFANGQAQEISRQFFKTERGSAQVVKRDGELETINVGRILVGRIAAILLQANRRVVLWSRGVNSGWEPSREATPGNYVLLAQALGQYFTKAMEDSAGNTEGVVASLHHSPSSNRVGVAVAHTSAGLLQLFEFADDSDWSVLEAVFVQQGVREVLVAAAREETSGPTPAKKKARVAKEAAAPPPPPTPAVAKDGLWKDLFARTGVAVTAVPDTTFRAPRGSSILEDLSSALLPDAADTTTTSSRAVDLAQASNMALALSALAALFARLDLRDPAKAATLRLEIGRPDSVLVYDFAVSHALAVFPENGSGGSYGGGEVMFDVSAAAGGARAGADGEGEGEAEAVDEPPATKRGTPDSLFGLINQTKTRMGSRLLRVWLQQPLCSIVAIRARQEVVSALVRDPVARGRLREDAGHLLRCPDIDKIANKLREGKASGDGEGGKRRAGLTDLLVIYRCILRLRTCASALEGCTAGHGADNGDFPTLSPLPLPLPSPSSATATATATATAAATTTTAAAAAATTTTTTTSDILSRMQLAVHSMSKFMALVEELVDAKSLSQRISNDGGGGSSQTALFGKRWVQVRPSFSAELARLSARLEAIQADVMTEHKRAIKAAGCEPKQLHLEHSSTHGLHLRATKKDSAKILKALASADREPCKVLSSQKQGSLFLTPRLAKLVAALDAARTEYETAQQAVVAQAIKVAATYYPVVQRASGLLAELDCLSCLAHVAAASNWTRPLVVEPEVLVEGMEPAAPSASGGEEAAAPRRLYLRQLRHPLVELILGPNKYVASDIDLREGPSCAIITGPNMGGKSTACRAVGLAVLLAHMGSFIPASHGSVVPLYDRLLARVGASDSLVAGLSTFMAEMLDVAKILKRASSRSLVITDEMGRGTSASDGFGLAYATIQRLACQIHCTSFVATHFHELTQLEAQYPQLVRNLHVSAHVSPSSDRVTMLYAVEPGASKRSYGVACARLARFPRDVVEEAEVLEREMTSDAT